MLYEKRRNIAPPVFRPPDPGIDTTPAIAGAWGNPNLEAIRAQIRIAASTFVRNVQDQGIDHLLEKCNKPTAEEYAKMCLEEVTKKLPKVKVSCCIELGGKIRGISLHDPISTHTARVLGNRMVATVKRHPATLEPMQNQKFWLAGLPDARLVSADLSKATDYFQHSLSQAIVRGAARGQAWTTEERDAMLHVMGPQELPDMRITKTGTHMGLSGTWAILNVVNAFAAYKARGDLHTTSSHRQCGDDLIGLYTRCEQNEYRRCIEDDLKLVYNQEKSYVGRSGRFCENFVTITDKDRKSTTAWCHPTVKIAEIVGAQECNGFSTSPWDILSGLAGLQSHPYREVRKGSLLTLKNLEHKLKLVPNLPLALGGSGRKTRSPSAKAARALVHYLHTGKKLVAHGALPDKVKEELLERAVEGRSAGLVPLSEYRVHLLTVLSIQSALEQGRVIKRTTVSAKAIIRQALRASKHTPAEGWEASPIFKTRVRKAFNPKTVFTLIWDSPKRLRRLATYALSNNRETFISRSRIEGLIVDDVQYFTNQNNAQRAVLGISPRPIGQ